MQLLDAAGAEWLIAPQPGDLAHVDAGLATTRGQFAISWSKEPKGSQYRKLSISAPDDTRGSVVLPGTEGTLVEQLNGTHVPLINGEARGLSGGCWRLELH